MSNVKKLAVLIDADNISADTIEHLLLEINKFGIANIKRLYGDWSNPSMNSWKAMLVPHAITPIQQFSYTKGKNATDIAMVIDAMDLLYQGQIDGFCLISSDSDFTKLALRIRESGLEVFGFGEQKTPSSLIQACTKFIHIESIYPQKSKPIKTESIPIQNIKNIALPKTTTVVSKSSDTKVSASSKSTVAPQTILSAKALLPIIKQALKQHSPNHDWVELEVIRANLKKSIPNFESKHYGFSKLFKLIQAFPDDFSLVLKVNIYSIKLKSIPTPQIKKNATPIPSKKWTTDELNANRTLKNQLANHIKNHADQNGWAPFQSIVKSLGKEFFTQFGYKKSSDLVKQLQGFELSNIGDTLCIKKYWSTSKIIQFMNAEISNYCTDEKKWMPISELSKKMAINVEINLASLGFPLPYEEFIMTVCPEKYNFTEVDGQKKIQIAYLKVINEIELNPTPIIPIPIDNLLDDMAKAMLIRQINFIVQKYAALGTKLDFQKLEQQMQFHYNFKANQYGFDTLEQLMRQELSPKLKNEVT